MSVRITPTIVLILNYASTPKEHFTANAFLDISEVIQKAPANLVSEGFLLCLNQLKRLFLTVKVLTKCSFFQILLYKIDLAVDLLKKFFAQKKCTSQCRLKLISR